MRFPGASFLFGALTLVSAARASLRDAYVAAEMLTDVADFRIVRVTLPEPLDPSGERRIYGVAFRFESLGWFYSAEAGTRILGPVAGEWFTTETIAKRLRQAQVPVTDLIVYPQRPRSPQALGQTTIANACVIGSLATLERLITNNSEVRDAGLVLLSFNSADASGRSDLFVDHCVLVYQAERRWLCVDPRQPETVIAIEKLAIGAPLDPALVEITLRSRYPLKSARLLSLSPSTLEQIRSAVLWRIGHPSWE